MNEEYDYSERWFLFEVFKTKDKKGKSGKFILPPKWSEGFETEEKAMKKYNTSYFNSSFHKVKCLKLKFKKLKSSNNSLWIRI